MAEKNPFMALAKEMDLYKDSNDQMLGQTIGNTARTLKLNTTEVINILKATRHIMHTKEGLLLMDQIATISLYTHCGPGVASPVLDRIIEFLSKCASLEEFETIVAKSTHPNN